VDGISHAPSTCDGVGACELPAPLGCGDYVCGADACLSGCAKDADCTGGLFCVNNVCRQASNTGEDLNGVRLSGGGCSAVTTPYLTALGMVLLLLARRRRYRGQAVGNATRP
jgi:uncharacterized protein (TIGR03382 family)